MRKNYTSTGPQPYHPTDPVSHLTPGATRSTVAFTRLARFPSCEYLLTIGASTADDHVNAGQNVRSSEDARVPTGGQTPRAHGLHCEVGGREHRAASSSR